MAFSSNPLSLSVPEAAFESWLRDSGYIELLDQRTSDLHRLSSSSSAAAATTSASTSAAAAATTTVTGAFVSLFSHLVTFLSLLSFNPFAKLSSDDFSAQTPPWTAAFFASSDAYSFPSSASQARLRVQENVKRYARNYASLFILFFACTLYQMPVALFGLISCLALWDVFKFCSEKWGLDCYPVARECVVRLSQCVGAVVMMYSNVQMALFCALGISYAGNRQIHICLLTYWHSFNSTHDSARCISETGSCKATAWREMKVVVQERRERKMVQNFADSI
ncbi:PRA1 family protein H isoform X2 [Morus notabilis]|uniref:PRA1 family protein H isoform X2 n=1 Tax=Morus notabilis TaxID=981085 RepID=UPI000CED48F7|nr:PRA1 family protein H isoform X2 [Morus notabilis]